MSGFSSRVAARAMLFLGCSLPLSASADPASCSAPGVTVLEDPAGDYSGFVSSITGTPGAGLPEQDILSLQVAQTGADLLQFTLTVAPFTTPALPPNVVWYTSFESADGTRYGVRLETDDTAAESMYSYLVAAGGLEDDGPSDGRFAEDGSEIPLEPGSGYTADGTITFVVKASNVGMKPPLARQGLGPFNAASIQGVNGVAVRGAFDVDTMPEGLSRDGYLDFEACPGKSGLGSGSGALVGAGALPLGTLIWLAAAALAAIRRRG